MQAGDTPYFMPCAAQMGFVVGSMPLLLSVNIYMYVSDEAARGPARWSFRSMFPSGSKTPAIHCFCPYWALLFCVASILTCTYARLSSVHILIKNLPPSLKHTAIYKMVSTSGTMWIYTIHTSNHTMLKVARCVYLCITHKLSYSEIIVIQTTQSALVLCHGDRAYIIHALLS